MSSFTHADLLCCFCFVVLEPGQSAFFGGVFQRIDAFLFGTSVFGLSTMASLVWVCATDLEPLTNTLTYRRPLFLMNVTTGEGWIAFLLSIQLIEPAVSFALFSVTVPLTTPLAAGVFQLLVYRTGALIEAIGSIRIRTEHMPR